MLKAKEIMEILDEWAAPYLIDNWDNTGFQIGNPEKEVGKILISLDLDQKALEKAKKVGAQMIITHHPLIFKPLKKITTESFKEKLIYDIIKEDIVIYNAHSNLDTTFGGVNDTLAKLLEIEDTDIIKVSYKEPLEKGGKQFGYGRVGNVKEMPLSKFLDNVKEKLKVSPIKVYGYKEKNIKRVAVCGGSGAGFIYDAYKKKADVYVTGDVKYHDAQLAYELGLVLVDANHFDTEKVILPEIKDYISKKTQNKVEVIVHNQSSPPVTIY